MQMQRILVPVGAVLLVVAGYRAWGWAGVAFAAGPVKSCFCAPEPG